MITTVLAGVTCPAFILKGRWWPVQADPGRDGSLPGGVTSAGLFLIKAAS